MQETSEPLTQLEQLKAILKQLAPNVSATDRNELEELHQISAFTISRYLKGDVRNEETAAKMVEYFGKKQQERQAIIEKFKTVA